MATTLELAQEHVAAEDRRDVAATLATFTDECIYRMGGFGYELHGKEAIGKHYREAFDAISGDFNNQLQWFDAGDHVLLKVRMNAVQNRPWGSLPATNRTISAWGIAHFERAPDGRLKGEDTYFNGVDFLYQAGHLHTPNVFELVEYIRKLERRIAELEGG
jgi:steroid delta-isomerase-like uncharacterized protein